MAGSRRKWGWHELDTAWADRLVTDAGVRPGDVVLDVGAGRGVITDALLTAGARVIAIELHPERVAGLRARFDSRAVTVVRADARDLRLPRRRFLVVANPPYGAVNPLLRRLLAKGSRLQSAHLVCQQQVARRWAGPTAPGAGRWGRDYTVGLGPVVPRRAFRPPPRVNSRLLVVDRRPRPPGRRSASLRSDPAPGRGRPGPR